MKRVAWSIAYLCIGAVLSWQSAVWISRLSRRLSWPLFNTRWHDCWDIEHCDVSAFGYAFIVAFVFAPCIVWALAGFKATGRALSRTWTALMLTIGTVCFYLVFYAAVWR
ncbi:hypothetical protein E2553_05030 [Paraburkholderia dipogonis]|uniref:Uncharacterized protein n=1 Tax=Paraburkholderia dipogonis TaxID=1211383 RepID=A0A4Y8N3R5_9BURK|nr:hypothetical protein [Paraburkholderia dipogonis]TFE44447.1 hypothetical protein E2553_05030 [Paraburkholderia dipogonis]